MSAGLSFTLFQLKNKDNVCHARRTGNSFWWQGSSLVVGLVVGVRKQKLRYNKSIGTTLAIGNSVENGLCVDLLLLLRLGDFSFQSVQLGLETFLVHHLTFYQSRQRLGRL